MVKWLAPILKFEKKGEKTSWTYIEISAAQAQKIKPDSKVSFRVKGKLDQHAIKAVALLPMGKGKFIMPLKGELRKILGKEKGDQVTVELEEDSKPLTLSKDLMACLEVEPAALKFFKSLPKSHQFYYSKWIDSAKTIETKTKRITMAVTGMAGKMSYGEMMRYYKDQHDRR